MEAKNQGTLPLNTCHVHKLLALTNRLHMLLHSTALGFLFYYRACFLFQDPETRKRHHLLPWLLVFASEIILSFIWILGRAFRWRPVSRSVFPERLPEDDKLPALDVLICTADPIKEPTLEVMNTALSAMALDYPPEKLHVYLSDDGGSSMTLHGMREAWKFARCWLPFCRRYRIKSRCPKAYFSALEDDDCDFARSSVYVADKKKIKEKYEAFKEEIMKFREDKSSSGDSPNINVRDHPSVIEVMQKNISNDEENVKMPLLVYVSREKRPSHPHHFKAGALNVLLRVSAMMSNSPYILVLDCDMFCNDPSSARYAMCFHLDPKMSSSLAFVQFPQKFHNVSKNDIYDSQLRSIFTVQWRGTNGLKGPVMSGTGFYIKRVSLHGNCPIKGIDLLQLKQYFGSSNEFIKSLTQNYTTDSVSGRHAFLEVAHSLASCNYEIGTKWGQEVGFLYYSVVEDYLTGFVLHCKGWTSVFCEPSRPQFLGTATTNLNEVLIQGTRWYCGLFENGISRFCPLISRMPLLQSMCYAELTYFPLYCLPLWCFATIPQLCLLIGIPLYPKVSDPFFIIFLFIFLSSLLNHLQEVFITGGTLLQWINEQRIWMMKSITCHLYGCLDALMNQVGIRQASFLPTDKAEHDEQTLLYQMDKYDFRASNIFIVPMLVILTINISCFVGGVYGVLWVGDWDKMFIQLLLAGFIITVNYPIIEGLVVRKDKGRISQLVAIRVILTTLILLAFFYYANKL